MPVSLAPLLASVLFLQTDVPIAELARDIIDPPSVGLAIAGENPGGGLLVDSASGPAAKAGVKPSDVIRKVGGLAINTWIEFLDAAKTTPLACELVLEIEREGSTRKVTIRLSKKTKPVSGGKGGAPGNHSVTVNGVVKAYRVLAPAAALKGAATPLALLVHISPNDMKNMLTMFDAMAKEAVVVAIDDNTCLGRDQASVDFAVAAVEQTMQRFNIDLRRVYAIGIWQPAALAYRLGLERSDLFAAVGVINATINVSVKPRGARKAGFVFEYVQDGNVTQFENTARPCESLRGLGYPALLLDRRSSPRFNTPDAAELWQKLRTYSTP